MTRRLLLIGLLVALPMNVKAQTNAEPAPQATAAGADVRHSPEDERARDGASRRAVATEDWDEALALTLDLVGKYGEIPDYLSRLATIYNRMHRPADETATWERFMTTSPHPDRACPMLGRAYRGLSDYEGAIDAFLRCLKADPKNPKLVYYAGVGYEWAGQLETSRRYYVQAIAMAAPAYDYRVALARLDLHEGRLSEARDRAVAVLAAVPTHTEGALVAGLAEQRAGKRVTARKHLELAAQLAPEYFDVRLALGILDFTEDRVPQARAHFEAAFLSDPSRRAEVQPWLDRTLNAK